MILLIVVLIAAFTPLGGFTKPIYRDDEVRLYYWLSFFVASVIGMILFGWKSHSEKLLRVLGRGLVIGYAASEISYHIAALASPFGFEKWMNTYAQRDFFFKFGFNLVFVLIFLGWLQVAIAEGLSWLVVRKMQKAEVSR
ncbi:MAG: hypothetical protein EOP06_14665 [Proteobacteria bacterium]|nr:MAG: hypothetical protein EOP06_14665 [Pseudomonadota bacterium]